MNILLAVLDRRSSALGGSCHAFSVVQQQCSQVTPTACPLGNACGSSSTSVGRWNRRSHASRVAGWVRVGVMVSTVFVIFHLLTTGVVCRALVSAAGLRSPAAATLTSPLAVTGSHQATRSWHAMAGCPTVSLTALTFFKLHPTSTAHNEMRLHNSSSKQPGCILSSSLC